MWADEKIMAAIRPDMRLTKDFLKRINAASVTHPDFPDEAIAALEAAGCTKARQYYENWVREYETQREIELKEVAHWYAGECRKEERERKRKERSTIERNSGAKHRFAGFPEDW